MLSLDWSRTASTAAAALLLGGLVIGDDVGKRVDGLLVLVKLEEVVVVDPEVVVAPVLPVVVVPVVVGSVVVELEDEVLLEVVESTTYSLYTDPK
jgi:hypothetical protein